MSSRATFLLSLLARAACALLAASALTFAAGAASAQDEEVEAEEVEAEEAEAPAAAKQGGLPEGWEAVEPKAGRKKAAFHREAVAHMESWAVAAPQDQVPALTRAFEARLADQGYSADGTDDLVINGYPATLRRFTRPFHGVDVDLAVIEVYRRGVLWQFSAVFQPGELLGEEAAVEALTAFATGQL